MPGGNAGAPGGSPVRGTAPAEGAVPDGFAAPAPGGIAGLVALPGAWPGGVPGNPFCFEEIGAGLMRSSNTLLRLRP